MAQADRTHAFEDLNETFAFPVFRRAVGLYRRLRRSASPELRALVECSAGSCALGRRPLSDEQVGVFDARAADLIARDGGGSHLSQPAWAGSGGSDANAFGLLPRALAGRTLLFVGDSVMRQVAIDLLLAVRAYREHEPPPTHVNLAVNTHCYVWEREACRFCFLRASRFGGTQRVPRLDATRVNASFCAHTDLGAFDLGDALACARHTIGLDARDVVLVNAGVHHNQPEVSLRANVQSFLEWHEHAHAQGHRPCTIWRETLPTHFHTIDGTFPSDARLRRDLDLGCGRWDSRCSPFSDALMREVRRGSTRQKFNDVANPLLERAGVPILRTFQAAASQFDVHTECSAPEARELDCVHHAFPSPAHQLVIHLLLLALEQRCGVALPNRRAGEGAAGDDFGGQHDFGGRHETCWPLTRCSRAGSANVFG